MTSKRDYYEILGVSKTASLEEIKRKYKELAKKYHPDVSKEGDATEKFKEISEAYAVLSDSNKKATYDQFGHQGFDQRYSQEDIFRGFDFDIFDEIFGRSGGGFGSSIFDMFFQGGGQGRRGPRKGSDLRYDIEITLSDAALGVKKDVSFNKKIRCDVCDGTGSKDGKKEKCETCKGTGQYTRSQRTPFGSFITSTPCHACNGTGRVIKNICKNCSGHGVISKKISLEVNIPAGVDTGSNLRIRGKGEEIGEGQAGDLYVVIHVKENDFFERRGDDIYIRHAISFSEAALGTTIEVPTLYTKVEIKIPAGTQSGTFFRLKSKGIKSLIDGRVGDQYVEIIVVTPTNLSKAQKELLSELSKTDKSKDLKFEKSFLSRVKDAIS